MKNGPLRGGVSPLRSDEEVLPLLERPDRRRQHADERVVGAVEANRLADRVGSAAEPLLPEPMADDHRRRAAGPAVRVGESRPSAGVMPSSAKYVHEHDASRQAARPPSPSLKAIAPARCMPAIALESRLLRLEREIVGDGERKLVRRRVGVDADEPSGSAYGSGRSSAALTAAKIDGRGADAEADGRDDRQRRAAARAAARAARCADPGPRPSSINRRCMRAPSARSCCAAVLARACEIAELPDRFASRRVGAAARVRPAPRSASRCETLSSSSISDDTCRRRGADTRTAGGDARVHRRTSALRAQLRPRARSGGSWRSPRAAASGPRGQRVVARAAVVLGRTPFRLTSPWRSRRCSAW